MITTEVGSIDKRIHAWHRSCEDSRRLEQIPGIGPIVATALVAEIGDWKQFRAATSHPWIGLVNSRASIRLAGRDRIGTEAAGIRPAADGSAASPSRANSLLAAGRRCHAVITDARQHGTKRPGCLLLTQSASPSACPYANNTRDAKVAALGAAQDRRSMAVGIHRYARLSGDTRAALARGCSMKDASR